MDHLEIIPYWELRTTETQTSIVHFGNSPKLILKKKKKENSVKGSQAHFKNLLSHGNRRLLSLSDLDSVSH